MGLLEKMKEGLKMGSLVHEVVPFVKVAQYVFQPSSGPVTDVSLGVDVVLWEVDVVDVIVGSQ